MLVVISPAKRLDEKAASTPNETFPVFQDAANDLAGYGRKLTAGDLQKLMGISENLARLNAGRFARFADVSTPQNAKQAALFFAGDTYAGLEAASLDGEQMDWAQDHLRILSGLYGVLRPRDLIQPYRLEMGSRLKTERGKNLYEYWGDRLSKVLNEAAENTGTKVLVNCASVEYFSAVDQEALKLRIITPVFMEEKAGVPKIVSFFAKKARGAMARFIIERRIVDPDGMKDFDTGGYRFNAQMSETDRPVFLRAYPEV